MPDCRNSMPGNRICLSDRHTLGFTAAVLMLLLSGSTCFAAVTSRPAAPPALTQESFQARISLEGKSGTVLALPLPEAVYSRLLRSDHRDMCVFDRNGAPVPFTVREDRKETQEFLSIAAVPFFPWDAGTEKSALPLRSDVDIDMEGGIVRVRRQQASTEPGSSALLLDLQPVFAPAVRPDTPNSLDRADIRELTLTLVPRDNAASFTSRVTMRTSADLLQWRSLGRPQALVMLVQDANRVERLDIQVLPDCGRYLLLEVDGAFPQARAFSAKALYADRNMRKEKERYIEGVMSKDKRSVIYDAGMFPLTRIGFALPQVEIMPVRLEAGSTPRGPWFFVTSGAVYRLEKEGAVVSGETFRMPAKIPDRRYWRLAAAGDIPFAAAPALHIRWVSHTLFFLSRGEGPWELAFGREAAVDIPALPIENLGTPEPALASFAPDPLPRPDAYKGNAIPAGMEQWMLWTALGLGVVFLSVLALYLMRSMNTGSKENAPRAE